MTSDNDFWSVLAVLVFLFCVANALLIPAPEDLFPGDYENAISACDGNGGLKKIELDAFTHDVYCNNGAQFNVDSISFWGSEQ